MWIRHGAAAMTAGASGGRSPRRASGHNDLSLS